MSNVRSIVFERAQPTPSKERLIFGGGNGLYLRIRPHGTKTWILDYVFKGVRAKPTLGVFDPKGAPGESISDWLRYGRLSFAQASAIAGHWKDARRAGHDPFAEWQDLLSKEREYAQNSFGVTP